MEIKEGVDLEGLQNLADWMKKNGVIRLRTGPVEIEFADGPTVAPSREEPKLLTEEELRKAAAAKRRRNYERELGRRLTDDELGLLP